MISGSEFSTVSTSLQSELIPYVAPEIEATYTGVWTQKTAPPSGYYLDQAVTYTSGNNAYFVARENNTQQTVYSVLIYDVINDKWTIKTKTPIFDGSIEGGRNRTKVVHCNYNFHWKKFDGV